MLDNDIVMMIDTNSVVEGSGRIKLVPQSAKCFSLKDGQIIKVYMENEMWDAIVHVEDNNDIEEKWSVDVLGEASDISCENMGYMKIGYKNGICWGMFLKDIEVAKNMFKLGYNLNQVAKIVELGNRRLDILYNQFGKE